jgi:hypothetical protein
VGADTKGGAKAGGGTDTPAFAVVVEGTGTFALVCDRFGAFLLGSGGGGVGIVFSSSESNSSSGLSLVPKPAIFCLPLEFMASARELVRGGGGGPERF